MLNINASRKLASRRQSPLIRFITACILTALSGSLCPFSGHANPLPGFKLPEAKPRVLKLSIPFESNDEVRMWIRYFSVQDRERFERFMERGAIYKSMIQDILIQERVPSEMYYLAMIESGFSVHATSWAKAVGVWQFMPATARQYGLRVDSLVDERRDVVRATRAAARYLKELHREFRSWHLAMAAYNCGENRVRWAIRRGRTSNYWTLARMGLIPSETQHYVPKFHAAMQIARNPEGFGFPRKRALQFPALKKARVARSQNLDAVARDRGVTIEAIRSINPHLIRARVPRNYSIWVPRT